MEYKFNYHYIGPSKNNKIICNITAGKLPLTFYKNSKLYHGWIITKGNKLTDEAKKLWKDNHDQSIITLPVIVQHKKGFAKYEYIDKNFKEQINSTGTEFICKSITACTNCVYDSFSNKNIKKLRYFRCKGHNIDFNFL